MRAWFNAQAQAAMIARGREAVEKLLQREGKTALKHADLAMQLGLRDADALFEVVGKDELSLKSIEALLRPAPAPRRATPRRWRCGPRARLRGRRRPRRRRRVTLWRSARALLPTGAADAIAGYIHTRGKGVAVHRIGCSNLRGAGRALGERVIDVAWGVVDGGRPALYPVNISVEASDRPGLLRDVSRSAREGEDQRHRRALADQVRDGGGDIAYMTFTVEVADADKLAAALMQVRRVPECARRGAADPGRSTHRDRARAAIGAAVTLLRRFLFAAYRHDRSRASTLVSCAPSQARSSAR